MRLCRSAPLAALPLAACTGFQSALDPAAPQAEALKGLMGFIAGTTTVVWLLVVLALLLSLRRATRHIGPAAPAARAPLALTLGVSASVVATAVIVTAFTVASFHTTRALAPGGEEALVIKLKGYQWWWEASYADPGRPGGDVKLANELHVPVGRPVRVELSAADVVHSFWVPALTGKQDMLPGRSNTVGFTATRPGIYRGQCAEFCGLQHAHMAMMVVAEPEADFERWLREQAAPAPAPTDAETGFGREVFLSKACAACHAVRGTTAAGVLGPDLTHVGSRRTIAAGLLPTTRGSLAAWIADPQTLKPGNNMPLVALSPQELQAVSAYLASLR
jgi:cytochrome c oxidase subunit 2